MSDRIYITDQAAIIEDKIRYVYYEPVEDMLDVYGWTEYYVIFDPESGAPEWMPCMTSDEYDEYCDFANRFIDVNERLVDTVGWNDICFINDTIDGVFDNDDEHYEVKRLELLEKVTAIVERISENQ